jgi:hypothetical protein
MRALSMTLASLALATSTAAFAETFDGSVPLQCTATAGHDCTPDKNKCSRLKAENDKPPVLEVDVAAKTVRSPYRTSLLPILNTTTNEKSLVLQGTDLRFAWSALINKTSGAMTISIADQKGAYVVFAQCKAAGAAPGG